MTNETIRCPNCGIALTSKAWFCRACGADTPFSRSAGGAAPSPGEPEDISVLTVLGWVAIAVGFGWLFYAASITPDDGYGQKQMHLTASAFLIFSGIVLALAGVIMQRLPRGQ